MNSAENLPSYGTKEEFKSSEIFPSLFRLLLMYIGAMDIIFSVLILIASLQKSIFNIIVFALILLSLAGGISCMKVAKELNFHKLDYFWKIGLVAGLIVGMFYFYVILLTLRNNKIL